MDALVLIASELNQYIKKRVNSEEENHVFLSSIIDSSGNSASPNDVITITLANVEEECVNKAQRLNQVRYDTTYSYSEPEIHLNLYVIISVRPSKNSEGSINYINALARLSMVCQFFQSRRYFDQSAIQNPNISPDLGRIIVDLHSSGFEQLSYIWGVHGGHYLPSLMYKVSLIKILEDATVKEIPAIKTTKVDTDRGGL